MAFLLLESGDRLTLEDGSGWLLLEGKGGKVCGTPGVAVVVGGIPAVACVVAGTAASTPVIAGTPDTVVC